MSKLDRTESSFIKQETDSMVQNMRIGRVQEVFEHVEEGDYSNFEVDVKVLGADIQHRAVSLQQVHNGTVYVPSVGDKVIVEYQHGDSNPPIARNTVYTNRDRPPVGKAGMWRQAVESGPSPAGDGDLYIESYTDYDTDPSTSPTDNATVEESWIRIGKKDNDGDTDDLPINIELYDSPSTDESHATIELNALDGSSSGQSWGIKFDLKTGEFKLLDSNGYGIVSDGSGNFTWHHEDVNFSQGTTDSL